MTGEGVINSGANLSFMAVVSRGLRHQNITRFHRAGCCFYFPFKQPKTTVINMVSIQHKIRLEFERKLSMQLITY